MRLDEDLVFMPQVYGEEIVYHIESPSQGKFFRVGSAEYRFLSLLDGETTVAQALTINARNWGAEALSRRDGLEVVSWLRDNRLGEFVEEGTEPTSCRQRPDGEQGVLQRLNPFWMKLSFGCPDRVLSALLPFVGWALSPWASLLAVGVMLFGAATVVTHWSAFLASAATVFSTDNWFCLALAWILLKLVHELAHGLTCKRYGGEVRDAGVIFVLLAPLAYVDVTSSWRFPSRWQRIHVALAGVYAEFILASVAAVVWARVDSPIIDNLLYDIIVMATLSTLLFNANPLMRFDGYYVLADLLEIPNLAGEGSKFVRRTASRMFFGEKHSPLQELGPRRWYVYSYGILSAAWRLLICFSLLTAASVLFEGAGLLLAGVGLVSWFGVPAWRMAADLWRRFHEARSSFFRAIATSVCVGGALAAALIYLPWPGALTAPAVVEYADLSIVRSPAPGFIHQIHVADGQPIQIGQLLVELRNDELAAERSELEVRLAQERVRHRVALGDKDGALAQIVLQNIEALEVRLADLRRRVEGLQVRSPVAGVGVARSLASRVGTYLQEGDELLAVGDESRKELVVSVGQEALDATLPRVGGDLRFRIHGRGACSGRLERLEPRASKELPHSALSAAVGGPLAVTEGDAGTTANLRLVEPRFRAVISLAPQTCRGFGAGEQGYVMLGLGQQSIGEFVWIHLRRWCESLLRPTT